MTPPTPDRQFLTAQIRWALSRGLPNQVAEDVVFDAYEKAASSFDPRLGSFEAYMQRVVRNDCAYWWRKRGRADRARAHLRLLPEAPDALALERAAQHQQALLDALDPDERSIFSAWALQKHLGKGQLTSAQMSRSLGLSLTQYENAKRRLGTQLQRLLSKLGITVADLLHGEDDVEQTG